jgi:homoaconitase/3-isopropylmalate dehydratase large subunit
MSNQSTLIHQLLEEETGEKGTRIPDFIVLSDKITDIFGDMTVNAKCSVPTLVINNLSPTEGGMPRENIKRSLECGADYYPPGRTGMPAMVCAEDGITAPGGCIVSTDKNLLELGVLGTLAIHCSHNEALEILKSGKIDFSIPASFGIELSGKSGKWVSGIDIALHIIKYHHLPDKESTCLEFYGEGLKDLPINERHNLARVLIDLGYEKVLFQVDEEVMAFLQDRCKKEGRYYFRDAPADLNIDLPDVDLMVAYRDKGGLQIQQLSNKIDLNIDQIFIGGDTACRYADFEKGLKVIRYTLPDVLLSAYLFPGSQLVYQDLLDTGMAGIFTEIGIDIAPSAFHQMLLHKADIFRTHMATSVRVLESGGLLAGTASCFAALPEGKIMHPQELESILKQRNNAHEAQSDEY